MHRELKYMYGLQRFGVKPGLGTMQKMMEALGHPETEWPSVHIAGTNGKGSTASFIATVLQEAGYTVGLYTSPHLVRFNERIQINNEEISDEALAELVKEMREKLEATQIEATFFEFTTALAFLYFARKKIDIAIIEVGMGGRLDATNVITPLISVITTIGLDHTGELGNTLLKIAGEKAGIMKPGVPVIVGEKKPEVLACLSALAKEKKSIWHSVQPELLVRVESSSLEKQCFYTEGAVKGEWEIGLLGAYQIDNASTALLALHYLQEKGFALSLEAIKNGLQKTRWAGRMEMISQYPLVIVDGAHNEDGVVELDRFIRQFKKHSVLLLAAKKDKDISYMLKKVVPLFDKVIVTEGTYEPMAVSDLLIQVKEYNVHVQAVSDTRQAVTEGLQGLPADGFLLATGSLYMIGQAREELLHLFLLQNVDKKEL